MCFNMIIFLLVLYMALNSYASVWNRFENPVTELTNTFIDTNEKHMFPTPMITIVSKNPDF